MTFMKFCTVVQKSYLLGPHPHIISISFIQGCQRAGLVCCLNGDGVNDAPALRKAHIGKDVNKYALVELMIFFDDNYMLPL